MKPSAKKADRHIVVNASPQPQSAPSPSEQVRPDGDFALYTVKRGGVPLAIARCLLNMVTDRYSAST